MCPQCDYSLTGLPANHACPECGLRYDDKSEIYRHRSPKAVLVRYAVMMALCVFWFYSTTGRAPFGVSGYAGSLVAATVYGAGFLLVLRLAFRTYRRGQVVASMPHALYVRLTSSTGVWFPWESLNHPVLERGADRITISRRDILGVVEIKGVFKDRADAERLQAQIEQRIAEANNRANSTAAADECTAQRVDV